MWQIMFDIDLVAIRKSKVKLIIFLDSAKFKIVWIEITTFFKRHV